MKTERKPTTQRLKTWIEYFQEIKNGNKRFEVRKNNRDFRQGDTLILQEWNNDIKEFTGEEMTFKVGYTLYGEKFGIKKGYCVMQLDS